MAEARYYFQILRKAGALKMNTMKITKILSKAKLASKETMYLCKKLKHIQTKLWLVFLFISLFFSFSSIKKMPDIGDTLPKKFMKEKAIFIIMDTGEGRSYDLKFDGIEYRFSVKSGDGEKENVIISIATNDPKFKTEEGYTINTTIKDIIADYNVMAEIKRYSRIKDMLDPLSDTLINETGKLIKERGSVFHIALKSGWNAAFLDGEKGINKIPEDTDKVSFFFKSRRINKI